MASVDALGNLIRSVLLPDQCHDCIRCRALKAFDNNWLRANLNERAAIAVIPSKADQAGRIPHDAEMYE